MVAPHPVYLEVGRKRVFAMSLAWPGWGRSAKSEDDALEALVAYARRYKKAARSPGRAFTPPATVAELDVVERVAGDGGTDFGVPGKEPKADAAALPAGELDRQVRVLKAAWKTFDTVAASAAGVALRKGPRGGGRDVDKIVEHVVSAEVAYLSKLGDKFRPPTDVPPAAWVDDLRTTILDVLRIRGRGETPPKPPRSGGLWSPAYFLRRTAWHALDHAWEIEDRSQPAS